MFVVSTNLHVHPHHNPQPPPQNVQINSLGFPYVLNTVWPADMSLFMTFTFPTKTPLQHITMMTIAENFGAMTSLVKSCWHFNTGEVRLDLTPSPVSCMLNPYNYNGPLDSRSHVLAFTIKGVFPSQPQIYNSSAKQNLFTPPSLNVYCFLMADGSLVIDDNIHAQISKSFLYTNTTIWKNKHSNNLSVPCFNVWKKVNNKLIFACLHTFSHGFCWTGMPC